MLIQLLFAIANLPSLTSSFFSPYSSSNDKILLTDVQVLTFYQDSLTTGRRSSPRPQIECRSGCNSYFPEELQCYNRGFDGVDVNWECKGNLPAGLRLSHVVVGCEGYSYPTDPYILRGSCQAIVSLSGDDSWNYVGRNQRSYSPSSGYYPQGPSPPFSVWSFLLFLGLLFILYQIFQHFQTPQQQSFSSTQTRMSPMPPSRWADPGNGGSFWSTLGWAGLLGSIFARRGGGRYFGPRRSGFWGNTYRSPLYYRGSDQMGTNSSRRREEQTAFARTERR